MRERLGSAFARAEPDTKRQAGGSSQAVRGSRSPGESPLPREQSAWLKRMLTNTMTATGEKVDETLTDIEKAAQRAEDVQRQATEAAMVVVAPIVEQLERVESRPSGATAAASSAAVARIGGIGWDSPAALLLERGKDVLARAGVAAADVSAVAPVTSRAGTGSSVKVAFVSTAALERARVQVRATAVVFEGQPREAWLDHQRMLQESR